MSAEFIKMISELHAERFNVKMAELIQNRTPCGIFFGFDFNPNVAKANVQSLINAGLNITSVVVISYVQAEQFKDSIEVPVIALENFPSFEGKPEIIFNMDSIKDTAFVPYFARYGMETIKLMQGDNFPFIIKHLPELYSAYEMLGSDESKKVFCAAIKGNTTGKISDYRFAPEPQYFLNGFLPDAGDVAIDGGAFDGATALDFAKCGANVYSFEMDANNYRNCLARLDNVGGGVVLIENMGLSDKESEENYYSWGAGSRKNSGGNLTGRFINLDTYVARKNLPRVDYIKLDIEGAELDMLHGAAKTITRCKPKMAVSAYHKPEDLWTLATYIKSLRSDYEFEFRHYRIDCADYTLNNDERSVLRHFELSYFLPTACETVLYCR